MKSKVLLVVVLLLICVPSAVFASKVNPVEDEYFYSCRGDNGHIERTLGEDWMFVRGYENARTFVVLDQQQKVDGTLVSAELALYETAPQYWMLMEPRFTNFNWTCFSTELEALKHLDDRKRFYMNANVFLSWYSLVESDFGPVSTWEPPPVPTATPVPEGSAV